MEPSAIESIIERVEAYAKTTIELQKLKLMQTATKVSAVLTAHTAVGVAVLLSIILIDIGASLWLGECLGKIYLGYFAVAAINILIAVLLHFFLLNFIKKPLENFIVKMGEEEQVESSELKG